MLETVTRSLAALGTPGSFATRRTCAAGDLHLQVAGVGRVALPLPYATARKLCSVARPAAYGLKSQTLHDPSVRDTWEIPASRVKIDEARWRRTLEPQLDAIRQDLGLPKGCTLKAELHNLLVYEPGQFFAPHQDSEKGDGMVGTLIVTIPSPFTGGAIVIHHHDQKVTYRGDASSSRWSPSTPTAITKCSQ